jgi:hypothetical protein
MYSDFRLTKFVSKTDIAIAMQTAAGKRDWEYLRTFFTDRVLYKVGASEKMRLTQDIIDYVSWLFANAIPRLFSVASIVKRQRKKQELARKLIGVTAHKS